MVAVSFWPFFVPLPGSSVVEQVTVNHLVAGSIPARAAILALIDDFGPTGRYHPVYHTYILQNEAGRFYIGHTDDLDRRLAEHNSTNHAWGKFTHKHGPWKRVWSESHPTRAAAMSREREIKSWKSSRSIRERILGSR